MPREPKSVPVTPSENNSEWSAIIKYYDHLAFLRAQVRSLVRHDVMLAACGRGLIDLTRMPRSCRTAVSFGAVRSRPLSSLVSRLSRSLSRLVSLSLSSLSLSRLLYQNLLRFDDVLHRCEGLHGRAVRCAVERDALLVQGGEGRVHPARG